MNFGQKRRGTAPGGRGGRQNSSGPGGRNSTRGGREAREGSEMRPGGGRFIRKKVCRLCGERMSGLDHKETDRLLKFLTEKGKILPQRISGNCARHQRMLARAVKRARHASLIPFEIGK